MKLYVTTGEIHDAEGVQLITWTKSQADASKAATAMKEKIKASGDFVRQVIWREVEVPTTKNELLVFLNMLTNDGGIRTVLTHQRLAK